MRVLLLGATGSLGAAILRQLVAHSEHHVTALVRDVDKFERLHAALPRVRVTVERGDASAAARLTPRHGALINAAGRPNEPGNDLEAVVTEVLAAAAHLAAPRILILTGGKGVLDGCTRRRWRE